MIELFACWLPLILLLLGMLLRLGLWPGRSAWPLLTWLLIVLVAGPLLARFLGLIGLLGVPLVVGLLWGATRWPRAILGLLVCVAGPLSIVVVADLLGVL